MMQSPGWWTYSWPGLPGLWYAGRWRGLIVALAFSVLLNFAFLVTFVPSFRVDRLTSGLLWATTAFFWFVSAWNSHLWAKRVARLPKKEDLDRIFVQAQEQYVRGHWVEAERILYGLLDVAPHDPEARLLLVGVLRRSGRSAEALDQLAELAASESSARWAFEIARERLRVKETVGREDADLGLRLAELPTDDLEDDMELEPAIEPEQEAAERRDAA